MTDDTTPVTAPRALGDFTDTELVLLASILRSGLVVHPNIRHRAFVQMIHEEFERRELAEDAVARKLVDRALGQIGC